MKRISPIVYPVIAAAVIALDQLTKYLVRSNMEPGDSIPLIGSWLRILYVRNTGTAFSIQHVCREQNGDSCIHFCPHCSLPDLRDT